MLLSGALAYTAVIFVVVVGEWCSNHPTLENVSLGLRWNPRNPSLWKQYSGYWLNDPRGNGSDKAVDGFMHAAALNPIDPANWDGLASAYLQTWNSPKAEAALRGWLAAVPHSPEAAWRLGNFLVIQDRFQEALPYLKGAATADPRLRLPLYDLAWKMVADPELILRELVPADPETRIDYLQFLIATKKFPAAKQLWSQVRGSGSKRVVSIGYYYVDNLIAARLADDAAKVWPELLADSGRSSAKPAGDLLTNGDFEAGLPNAGLDWRTTPDASYQIGLDDSAARSGLHSLLVSFDGSSNPDFIGVMQMVPVEPSRDYRLSGFLKTENLTSDSGVRISVTAISDAPADRFEVLTENRVGTTPWTQEHLDFRTGPATHFVTVALRRLRSVKLNNLIQGKVWMDSLSLKARL